MDNTEDLNQGIAGWSKDTHTDLKNELTALGVRRYKYSRNPQPLRVALKVATKKQRGLINRISFKMPRSAVFLQKGVSRGHGKANPRQRKEWFNPVDENLPKLADVVADGQGTYIINSLKIK